MIPHERSLVKRLSKKPFAVLGVSPDPDREELVKFIREQGMTWPVWWDKGFGGPIVTRWRVRGYPTVYVLDHRGTIRFKGAGGAKALEAVVEQLLAEVKPPPRGPAR